MQPLKSQTVLKSETFNSAIKRFNHRVIVTIICVLDFVFYFDLQLLNTQNKKTLIPIICSSNVSPTPFPLETEQNLLGNRAIINCAHENSFTITFTDGENTIFFAA